MLALGSNLAANLLSSNTIVPADFLEAATNGNLETITELIMKEAIPSNRLALINTVDKYTGNTPLHNAAMAGSSTVVRLLLENGATLNSRDKDRRTPLHLSAEMGHPGVTKLLLDQPDGKKLVDSRNVWSETPLRHAVLGRHLETVKLLVESGADVNARDQWRETPLMCATTVGRRPENPEVTKVLKDHGAR
jgi:ankyrin repeat protein